jgi:hypothetical protein
VDAKKEITNRELTIPFYPKEHEQINRLKDRQAFECSTHVK